MTTESKENQAGFQRPRQHEPHVQELLKRRGLPEDASLKQVEAVATSLLNDPHTIIEGTELIMGRRVDARDPLLKTVFGVQAKDRFGALLLISSIEEMSRDRE